MFRIIMVAAAITASAIAGTIYSEVHIVYENAREFSSLLVDENLNILRNYKDGYFEVVAEKDYVNELINRGWQIKIVIPDLEEYFAARINDGGVFGNYYLYSEIRQAGQTLQNQYPGILKFDSLAIRSIENRALYLIKASNSPGSNNNKPEVLISGAIHAYEPIGPSVIMSDIMHLCQNYSLDSEIKWLVDNRQIYFLPVMNPDGYVYNETYPTRMWRKNRRLNGNGSYGVDLNRNYPYKWGYDNNGSSGNPSAWNYRGTAPASEPETQSIIDFVNAHSIRTWHNHHSPGDVLLIPFSYIDSYPWGDTLEYYTICREESLLYGFVDWGNSTQAYGYPCNGELGDWAWCDSAAYKIYGLVPELGPDYWGGLNDTNAIVQICQNMLPAELYLMKIAGFYPESLIITVFDSFPGGNNDGFLNPGETAVLRIRLSNIGVVDTAMGLTGIFRSASNYLRVSDSTASYGDIIRLSRATNIDPFVVACSSAATPNSWIDCSLQLVWDYGNYQKPIVCSLYIGPYTKIAETKPVFDAYPDAFIATVIKRSMVIPDNVRMIEVFDLAGRNVLCKPGVNTRKILINLPQGVYVVCLYTDEDVVRRKLIIVQ